MLRKLAFVTIWFAVFAFYWRTQHPDLRRLVIPYREALPEPPEPRPVYPHSVIPGGVLSGGEVQQAMLRDGVIRAHYAGIDPATMRPMRLVRDTPAYVSFRIKDAVYWTSHKINLHKGEVLMTDGKYWVRSRCGNRIALALRQPFLPPATEPKDREFDIPVPELASGTTDLSVADVLLPSLPEFPRLKAERPNTISQPEAKPRTEFPRASRGSFPRRPFAPVPEATVPEPSTLLMICAGFFALMGRKLLRNRDTLARPLPGPAPFGTSAPHSSTDRTGRG